MSAFYPTTPTEIAAELMHLTFNWYIAGGWALELFKGQYIREHHDMDIALLRRDQLKLKQQLPGWEFKIGHEGVLHEWGDFEIQLPMHGIWARKHGDDKWRTEFVLNEADDKNWIFRKDNHITYPLAKMGVDVNGFPVLEPIIALLYKAKSHTAKNEIDVNALLPVLDDERKRQLKEWLVVYDAGNEWLGRL
ncbi:MAG TPA: hypothetical protein VK174_13195 [Chitinophagales bacterium]|nr:hypothetical protein [Chitinophagales bacterium]